MFHRLPQRQQFQLFRTGIVKERIELEYRLRPCGYLSGATANRVGTV